MKKAVLAILAVVGLSAGNIKSASYIKIEKNISKKFALNMQAKAKKANIGFSLNPKVSCLNANFSKKDIFAKGVMMGKNRKDGSLEVSGVGDFKAYSYIRYKKANRECIEYSYTKKYDPSRFGNYSYMVYR